LFLALDGMSLSVAILREIVVDAVWKHLNLSRDEPQQRDRRPLARTQRPPRETQVAEHQCVTEAIMVATAASDYGKVGSGECVVPDQLMLVRRRLKQFRNLRLAQRACKDFCVKVWFHQDLLCEAEPVAEQDGELCLGSGPLALRHLPVL
jgi:hypothetical protein